MKVLKYFFVAVAFVLIFIGAFQVQEAYAIPLCGDTPCKTALHYCDDTPCYCRDSLLRTTCAGYCENVCDGF